MPTETKSKTPTAGVPRAVRSPIMERLATDPLLLDPSRQPLFQSCVTYLEGHELAAEFAAGGAVASGDFWADQDGRQRSYRPYIVKDGILQIPVQGVLLHRFPYQLGGWATGYEYISKALQRGLDDSAVKGIALVVDSPGGMVAGCFELVDEIYAARGRKPIRGFSADHAYSAAFAIISASDRIAVTRSGGTGSVGVLSMHVDYAKMMDDWGVKVTLIHAGKHKVDGNPYEALPETVRARIQARVDKSYAVFVSTVARNRNMSEDAVRATEALTYDAQDSVEVGFADAIGSLDDETAKFVEETQTQETDQMTDKNTQAPDAAALATATEKGRTEGYASGMKDQKDRITAILGSDVAKTRPAAAMAAAIETDMTVDQAAAFLAKLPNEAAPAATKVEPGEGTNALATAMTQTPNPEVGANTSQEAEEVSDEDKQIAAILGASSASTGVPLKK